MGRPRPDATRSTALRPERHVAKWVSFGALALVIVLIVAAGFAGWWYVRQVNPAGERGGARRRSRRRTARRSTT